MLPNSGVDADKSKALIVDSSPPFPLKSVLCTIIIVLLLYSKEAVLFCSSFCFYELVIAFTIYVYVYEGLFYTTSETKFLLRYTGSDVG